jgi:hypothetical protein
MLKAAFIWCIISNKNYIIEEGGEKEMKIFLVLIALLFTASCATKEYVKQQIDPLVDKISQCQACCEQNKKALKKSFELQQKK